MKTGRRRLVAVALLFIACSGSLGGPRESAIPPEIREVLAAAGGGRKFHACRLVDGWLRDHGGDVGAHVVRGDLRLDCLDASGAIEDFRAALARTPGDRYATGRLLEALQFARRYDEAADLLSSLARRDPANTGLATSAARLRSEAARLRDYETRRSRYWRWIAVAALGWILLLGFVERRLAHTTPPAGTRVAPGT